MVPYYSRRYCKQKRNCYKPPTKRHHDGMVHPQNERYEHYTMSAPAPACVNLKLCTHKTCCLHLSASLARSVFCGHSYTSTCRHHTLLNYETDSPHVKGYVRQARFMFTKLNCLMFCIVVFQEKSTCITPLCRVEKGIVERHCCHRPCLDPALNERISTCPTLVSNHSS